MCLQILRDPSKRADLVAVQEKMWDEIEARFNAKRPVEKRLPKSFLKGVLKVYTGQANGLWPGRFGEFCSCCCIPLLIEFAC